MTLAADMLDLFEDTVTWNQLSAQDSYGNPTFSFMGEYPARRVQKNRKVRDKDAQEVVSTQQVWILPSLTSGVPFPLVRPDDQVVLSDGSTPQIASVQIFEDDQFTETDEPSHTVVFFL